LVWLSAIVGLILLLGGAEMFLRGAVHLSLLLQVPVVVIGVTVAAYGALAPEVGLSTTAAVAGEGTLAMAAVLGANVVSLALVVGVAALRGVADVSRELVRREVPGLLALSAAVPLALHDGVIGRIDGLAMVAIGVSYTLLVLRDAIDGRVQDDRAAARAPTDDFVVDLAVTVVGGAMVVGGAWFVAQGAIGVADALGTSARVIAATAVALALRSHDLLSALLSTESPSGVVGNALSTTLLSVSMGLGLAAMLEPIVLVDHNLWREVAAAGVMSALWLPLVLRGGALSRLEGGLLIAAWLGYVAQALFT
jgi:cation:H+ antiporter